MTNFKHLWREWKVLILYVHTSGLVWSMSLTAKVSSQVTGRPSMEDVDAIQSPFAATMLESLPPTKQKLVHEVSCWHSTYSASGTWFLASLISSRGVLWRKLLAKPAFSKCWWSRCWPVVQASGVQSRQANHGRGSITSPLPGTVPQSSGWAFLRSCNCYTNRRQY